MNLIMSFFGRYILAAALVIAYIEAGPGGDKVGATVNTVKRAVLSFDWNKLATNMVVLVTDSQGGSSEVKNIEKKS